MMLNFDEIDRINKIEKKKTWKSCEPSPVINSGKNEVYSD